MDASTLLVYGDASIDVSLRVERLPDPGLDAAARGPRLTPGGSAANCAAAAARLGARVDLVAAVGDDPFSDLLIEDLDRHGVGTDGVWITPGPSPLVVTLIDPRGQRTFISARGPAALAVPPERFLPLLEDAAIVHLSGYAFQDHGSRSTAHRLRDEARRRRIPVSLDPSPLFAERHRADLGRLGEIHYAFPNLHEAAALTGGSLPGGRRPGPPRPGVGTVVITMGDRGCLLHHGDAFEHVTAVADVPVADTSGAGDAFAGAFLAAVLEGADPSEAASVANRTAARIITEVGGHTAHPSPYP